MGWFFEDIAQKASVLRRRYYVQIYPLSLRERVRVRE
jgi:hypothetical protein